MTKDIKDDSTEKTPYYYDYSDDIIQEVDEYTDEEMIEVSRQRPLSKLKYKYKSKW